MRNGSGAPRGPAGQLDIFGESPLPLGLRHQDDVVPPGMERALLPTISRSYQDLATHYGTAVLPARVRRPRDKAKVEVAVQVVQRWILARLRHRRVFSLAELNGAIRELVADLNARPMRHLGISRQALFDRLERPALLELPAEPYVYAAWQRCRAGLDYHVEVLGHFYSVPYRLAREVIEARITEPVIELFHRGSQWPTICGVCGARARRRRRSTCRARTGATPSGRPPA